MKIVPLLCVLVLCVNQVLGISLAEAREKLKQLEEDIKQTKGKVDDSIRDINEYRNNLQFNFDSKLAARESKDVKTIRCMTDLLLEEIRVFVSDAREQGKNPDKCYEHSHLETTNASSEGYTNLDKCTEEAKDDMNQAQTAVDNVVTTGHTLLTELDKIFPDCYTRLPRIMLKCVNRKMEKIDVSVKNFESSVESVKTVLNTAFTQGYRQGIACFQNVLTKTRATVRNIRADSMICINKS